MRIAAVLILLALAGCNRDVLRPDPPPKLVYVPVEKLVPLAPELTADCLNEPAKAQTYAEAKRLANLRDASLKECNKRLFRIRSLQP